RVVEAKRLQIQNLSHSLPRRQVTDSNDNAPVFVGAKNGIFNISVSELLPPGSYVTRIRAKDVDSGANGEVRYSVEGGSRWFQISPQEGIVTLTSSLDFETQRTHHVTIVATDQGSPPLQSLLDLWINVEDHNDSPPSFLTPNSTAHIAQDASRGQLVTVVRARDPDVSDQLKFTLVAGNTGDAFYLDSRSGVIEVSTPPALASHLSFSLNVSVTDSIHTAYATVLVRVLPVNRHSPRFQRRSYSVQVPENAAPGTLVDRVRALDADDGPLGEVTYQILSDRGRERFHIHPISGRITTLVPFDRETQPSFTLPLMAADGGGRADFVTLFVAVTDVNDVAPVFVVPKYWGNVWSNASTGDVVLQVHAKDPDEGLGSQILYSLYELSNGTGLVKEFFAIQELTGEIKTRQSLEKFENEVFQFFVRATDAGTPALHSDVPVDLIVMSREDVPPMFNKDAALEVFVPENAPLGFTITTLSASLPPSSPPVRYSLLAPREEDLDLFDVDQEGSLSVSGPIDRETNAVFRLTVLAQTVSTPPLSVMSEVILQVMDDNDNLPVFEQSHYVISTPENLGPGETILKLSAQDADTLANGNIQYSLSPDDLLDLSQTFALDPVTGALRTLVPLDREKRDIYEFQVLASDGASSANASVKILVLDLNDSPLAFDREIYVTTGREGMVTRRSCFVFAVREDARLNTAVVQLSHSDTDSPELPSTAALSYLVLEGSERGEFSLSTAGEVLVTGALDRERRDRYDLRVAVTDGSFLSTTRVKIDVLDVNDNGPVCPHLRSEATLSEAAPLGTSFAAVDAFDPDVDPQLEYSLSGEGAEDFRVDRNKGRLEVFRPLDRESRSAYDLTVTVRDAAFSGREQQAGCVTHVLVKVTDVNDCPPLFAKDVYSVSVPEDTPPKSVLTKVHATDKDLGKSVIGQRSRMVPPEMEGRGVGMVHPELKNPLFLPGINRRITFELSDEGHEAMFSLHPRSGLLTLLQPLDREKQASYNLSIRATDAGFPPLSSDSSIFIVVLDINDNPPVFSQKAYQVSIPPVFSQKAYQ
ncbi:unnamed protein product, partial [Cyprideis torosa]